MHPLIEFAKKLDTDVVKHIQSLYLKSVGNSFQSYTKYIPLLYFLLSYFGQNQQTFGESIAMIKIYNPKGRLMLSLLLKYALLPSFPKYQMVFEELDDIFYFISAIPGFLALFNLRYSKIRNPLPFDNSRTYQIVGIIMLIHSLIHYSRKISALSLETNKVSDLKLCQAHLEDWCKYQINNLLKI
eukprot:NODE_2_length_91304_cov_0.692462.p53 type:complete len:185 gc:universal NODE_2_length_91304_cov_0.692462:54432-53878(-)